MQKGSIIGDIAETFKDEGKKIFKETAKQVTSINILEGLDPVNPAEVAEKSKMYKEKDKQKFAQTRSKLHQEIQAMKMKPIEDVRQQPQEGVEMAEQGKANQTLTMNNINPNGPQPLSASMTPKKKVIPLAVQQKRKDKLQGAG